MPISYYGDERDSPPEEPVIEKKSDIVVESKESIYNKTYKAPTPEEWHDILNKIKIPFRPNMGDTKREVKNFTDTPVFHAAFQQACAEQLPAPVHIGMKRLVRVRVVDENAVYDNTVNAMSMERDGKLTWAYDKSIY